MDQATALAVSQTEPSLAPSRVAALVPCHRELPRAGLLAEIAGQVGAVLVVDDGVPASVGARFDLPAAIEVVRLAANAGKGHAVAAGIRTLLARSPAPEAVLLIDCDGQHPPAAIPSFLAAAAGAQLVIGDRLADVGAMPLERRLSNRLSTAALSLATGTQLRDSQCGMRLLRGRALHEIAYPRGGYEAETRHLKRCLRAGVRVAWVPIPAIYRGEESSFGAVRDTLRVAWAVVA
jgi:dolichol-phosphate mannosyltransferase